jgi:hypothetical protein
MRWPQSRERRSGVQRRTTLGECVPGERLDEAMLGPRIDVGTLIKIL